ncbi:MAG: patatin-like phospholipase family protein [Prevotella sp.]|nr:patatin-like phospholipase family protein [Prevotella sp.]
MKRILLLSFFLTAWLAPASQAQTVSGQQRPKVAVVLSGGGAKGMAHIGALRVIERAGIPIDIITGTSIGSLIGGLYAIGYDAEKLDSLVRAQDWGFLLSDKADLKERSLGERKMDNTYFITRKLQSGSMASVKVGGAIEGKNLAKLFSRLTEGYHDSMSFSRLPIPFACVATNIVDNTEVDWHSGVLAQAMRSSMSIPGAFTPVRKGDMILVDGGLRNNFPVDVARQMGADYVIGVTLQGPPKTADELEKSGQIISQIVDVNCKNKYEENKKATDILISCNTQGYSAASFNSKTIDTLEVRGEAEAMKHWDELMALKRKLGLSESYKPQPLTPPRPENHGEDEQNAQSSDSTQSGKEMELALGVRFDNEEYVSLQAYGQYKPKADKPLATALTLRLGKRIMAKGLVEWAFHRNTKSTLSYTYRHNDIYTYQKARRQSNILYNQHEVNWNVADFNVRNFNVKLGMKYDFYNYNEVLHGNDERRWSGNLEQTHLWSYNASTSYNSEDKWYFPTRGAAFRAAYAYYTSNLVKYDDHSGYSVVNASWRMNFGLTHKLTLQPMVYGRLVFGHSMEQRTDDNGTYETNVTPLPLLNVVGGNGFHKYLDNQQLPLAGVNYIEVADNKLVAIQMKLQQQIADNNYLLFKASASEHADNLSSLLDHGPKIGVEVAYYYDLSFLGPIGGSFGWSSLTHKPTLFINLGYSF